MDPVLDFFLNFQLPPLILAIFIGIPSAAVYLFQVILVIAHWNEFNSSFFKLFIVRAIPSIWNLFSSYWSIRLPILLPLHIGLPLYLRIPPPILLTFFFGSYYTYHVENLSTFFLILNRLTSILLPFRHPNLWRIGFPIAVAIILLLPIPFNYTAFGLKAEIFFFDSQNKTFTFIAPKDEFPFSRIASISAIIFITICSFLNVVTIVAYRRHQSAAVNGIDIRHEFQQKQEALMESRLTKYAVITFFCQISMGFCFLTMLISQSIGTQRAIKIGFAIFNFYPLINDIFTVTIPAWSMLWTSSKMRQLFAQKFPFLKGILTKKGAAIGAAGTVIGQRSPSSIAIKMTTIDTRRMTNTSYNLRM